MNVTTDTCDFMPEKYLVDTLAEIAMNTLGTLAYLGIIPSPHMPCSHIHGESLSILLGEGRDPRGARQVHFTIHRIWHDR